MNGLPQNVLLNFRLEFPKSDLTIYLPSRISEIFCQMVSTPDLKEEASPPLPLLTPSSLSPFLFFSRWRPRSMYLRVSVKKRLNTDVHIQDSQVLVSKLPPPPTPRQFRLGVGITWEIYHNHAWEIMLWLTQCFPWSIF